MEMLFLQDYSRSTGSRSQRAVPGRIHSVRAFPRGAMSAGVKCLNTTVFTSTADLGRARTPIYLPNNRKALEKETAGEKSRNTAGLKRIDPVLNFAKQLCQRNQSSKRNS